MLIRRTRQGFVIGLCKCGHLACDHSSHLVSLGSGLFFREYHQGGCCNCGCKQFTFHRFVPIQEAANQIMEQRLTLHG